MAACLLTAIASRYRAAKSKCQTPLVFSPPLKETYFSQHMHFLNILAQVHVLKVKPRLFLIGQYKQQRWIA